MSTPPQQPGRTERLVRHLSLIIGNVIRLGGLYLLLKAAAHPPIDPLVLGETAFMMSGAQITESGALKLIDRFLGREPTKREP